MRTQEDLFRECQRIQKEDLFGFGLSSLFDYLTLEQQETFIKADKLEEFRKENATFKPKPIDRETVIADIKDYMTFALDKASNHRGLSAERSVERMKAWLWLLGDEELIKKVEDADYMNYGVPKLKVVCEALGIPFPASGSLANMANGKPCCDDCDEGCGRG